MAFYRLIKPNWGKPKLSKKVKGEWVHEENPDFIQEIKGKNTVEGFDFTNDFLKQKNEEGYNVYFFPNHPSTNIFTEEVRSISGKHIDVFNYVFVDMDLKEGKYKSKEEFLDKLSEFAVPPSLTVDSGNGIHSYWRISDLTRETYLLIQRGLINLFNTDDSVWTILQLMRYPGPGFKNTKIHGKYKEVIIQKKLSSGKSYKTQDLMSEVKSFIKNEDVKVCQTHLDKLDGKIEINISAEDIDNSKLPAKFVQLIEDNPKVNLLFNSPKDVISDRSAADMKLANILYNEGFNIKEATSVLCMTEKAREKGSHALDYAVTTISKVYNDRPKFKAKTASQWLKERKVEVKEPQILGPYYMDYGVLAEPWRKKELLGIIAGSGVGKTALALNIIKETIVNNENNDDVYIFFSLEMSAGQVISRWISLVGENSPLTDRLYVIDTLDEKNMPIAIGIQEMYEYCQEIKQTTGKNLGAIVIDHFHIVSRHIDTSKKLTWGADSEANFGNSKIKQLSPNSMATQIKSLVQTLNTFGILLSQTTKEKGQGDTQIGKDGSYGISQFEWIMDRIITIWQPLMRVYNQTSLRFLAWQYAKIREKRQDDKIQELNPKLLLYKMIDGSLTIPNEEEYQEFIRLIPLAKEARINAEKKNTPSYAIQADIKNMRNLVLEGKVKL